jgi:hypothetical protein
VAEAVLGLAALLSLLMIFILRDSGSEEHEGALPQFPEPSQVINAAREADKEPDSMERLEESRFL